MLLSRKSVCVHVCLCLCLHACVYVCTYVCVHPWLLLTSGVMWHDMDPICLIKQLPKLCMAVIVALLVGETGKGGSVSQPFKKAKVYQVIIIMLVSPPPRLLITSGVIWLNMDSTLLDKQGLQLLTWPWN